MLIPLSIILVFFVVCDQLSKITAVNMLVDVGSSMNFIPGVIRFEYYKNTGMAWGLFQNASWLFIIVSLILGAGIVYFIIKYRSSMPRLMQVSLTLILSGAVGNLIDRIFLGYVRDFIAFDFFNFPVFNIADSCVTVGAVILAVCIIFTKQGRDFFNLFDDSAEKKKLGGKDND